MGQAATNASGSGAVLGGVPDAQDHHRVGGSDPIDDEVGRHDHQLSRSGLASGPAAMGEHHQAVTGEQDLPPDPLGCDRIIGRDVADDPADIGQGPGTPDDRQRSARLGRRSVELTLGEPQQPGANRLMRYRSRVRIRLGDGRRKSAGFSLDFVILDQGSRRCHADRMGRGTPDCNSPAIWRSWSLCVEPRDDQARVVHRCFWMQSSDGHHSSGGAAGCMK